MTRDTLSSTPDAAATAGVSSSSSGDEQHWDVVVRPSSRSGLDLQSAWRYRGLAWMFFKRDFSTFYKQTVLGPIWYVIQPLVTAVTYLVVFAKIANLSTDNLPPLIFYMSGTVIWNFFASCMNNNCETFSKNSGLFGKVYFPRLVVPVAVAMGSVVTFAIQFSLLIVVGLIVWANGTPLAWSANALFVVPLLVIYTATLAVGAGLVVSALTVRYRDLVFLVSFMTQLWMYATPIVYPFAQVPERFQWFYHLNPMTTPAQTLRWALFEATPLPPLLILSNLAVTALVMLCGLLLFSRAEATAMDTV